MAQDSAGYEQPRGNRMPPVPKSDFQKLPARFSFAPDATALLHQLWNESAAEKREHVGCLAGEVREDSVRVTRVKLLEVGRARFTRGIGPELDRHLRNPGLDGHRPHPRRAL